MKYLKGFIYFSVLTCITVLAVFGFGLDWFCECGYGFLDKLDLMDK